MSKVTPCSLPPGGNITCNDDQLAICGVIDGKIVAGCFDPPPSVAQIPGGPTKAIAMANWALSQITGESRDSRAEVTDQEFSILSSGKYVNPSTKEEVSFSLPADAEAGGQAQLEPEMDYR
jgi:hypothetical protein